MYGGETKVKAVFLISSKADSLEIRGFSLTEICRNMQNHMLSKQTYVDPIELLGNIKYGQLR